jgi:hypothetical protein
VGQFKKLCAASAKIQKLKVFLSNHKLLAATMEKLKLDMAAFQKINRVAPSKHVIPKIINMILKQASSFPL